MKFGVLYDLRNSSKLERHVPWPDYYAGAFEHMEEMELAGFDALGFAEHHGDPDGYNPAQRVMLGAAAMRTKKVRLAAHIMQLPLHNPVLAAEELAVIDVISGGRLDVGIGQGAAPFAYEYEMLGLDPKHRVSRMSEGVEIMIKAWTSDEPFDYVGKRFDLRGVQINPRPLQGPHPPVFVVGAFSEKSMRRVAEMGLGVAGFGGLHLGLTGGDYWRTWLADWNDALEAAGRERNSARIWTLGRVYVTDDPERAWAKHRTGMLEHITYESRPGLRPYVDFADVPATTPEELPNWSKLFATPDQVIQELVDVYSDGAPDELHLYGDAGYIGWEDTAEYLRNFADKVIPKVTEILAAKKNSEQATRASDAPADTR